MTRPGRTEAAADRAVAPVLASRHPRTELSDAAVVSRSWAIAAATLVSRITGFLRMVLLAAILGAALTSAFSVANQLPNLIAALVLEATFTAIFVPVLARAEREDPDGGAAFVRRLVTLATALLVTATVVSLATTPLLVRLMLGADPLVDASLTVAFAYLLVPQVLFYGLSSVFMAVLNNRNVFGAPAWAPVVNNLVAIVTLVVYLLVPGELSLDPVRMGDAKLLVLGVGTTLGVVAQAAVLLRAVRHERVSLAPLWGVDARLRQFGAMAAAMVLYVLISQLGLVVGNQIAAGAAASGPAIYNYTWLVLQLPFGMIGVTVLTVVMPRLSRHAAANDTPGVLRDLSLATRLTMITLVPVVAFLTVGGPAVGSALFAYGNFGDVDAGHLGVSIALSAFTLIPYALVLLHLRVFYARQEPWTPILVVVVITSVKVATSLVAPLLAPDPALVAAYLGFANGLGFLAGATAGHLLLRRTLAPAEGHLVDTEVLRTVLVTVTASLLAGLLAYLCDRLLGFAALTDSGGGAGSLLRLTLLALIMGPVVAGVLFAAKVPEARAVLAAVRTRLGRAPRPPEPRSAPRRVGYADPHRGARTDVAGGPHLRRPRIDVHGVRKGQPVTDDDTTRTGATPTGASRDARSDGMRSDDVRADAFHPDVPDAPTTVMPSLLRGPGDFAGQPGREPLPFDVPQSSVTSARGQEDVHLVPGGLVVDGRYRLLVFHGGPTHLQFWQALDTALDRQVALTFVGADGGMSDGDVDRTLERTSALSRVDRPGLARVHDVIRTGWGGLVVAEWIRGGSLEEVADTAPSAIGGARATQSLAAAADAAHQAGAVLGIDHPGRIRVSIDGDVAVAFPATLPDADADGDVRGVGAALYALLVDRWPLSGAEGTGGMPPAELRAGEPLEPKEVDDSIPFPISAAAARAVQRDGGIRSAATLLAALQQATAAADRTDHLPPVDPADDVDPRDEPPVDDATRERRRRGLVVGLAVSAVAIVGILVLVAVFVNRLFGDVGGSAIDGAQLGVEAPSSSAAGAAAGDGPIVRPVRATVFSPDGGADNPDDAGLAIDGDPATVWATDAYTDPNPFPNFKNGVGLLLELPRPTTVTAVTVDLTSVGTQVQVRSASSATPATLEDTTALTPPTPTRPGANRITVDGAAPTTDLVVWISTLGTVDGLNRSDISEITVEGS